MDKVLLKVLIQIVIFVIAITVAIYYLYKSLFESFMSLIRADDYIFYAPQLFPLLLLFPIVVLFDLFFILLLFPFRRKMKIVLERYIAPIMIYGMSAIALGIITSFVVSIYPLSTHYYKCDSTSIISSGSHYARTKEMCKEQKKLRIEKFMGKE